MGLDSGSLALAGLDHRGARALGLDTGSLALAGLDQPKDGGATEGGQLPVRSTPHSDLALAAMREAASVTSPLLRL